MYNELGLHIEIYVSIYNNHLFSCLFKNRINFKKNVSVVSGKTFDFFGASFFVVEDFLEFSSSTILSLVFSLSCVDII